MKNKKVAPFDIVMLSIFSAIAAVILILSIVFIVKAGYQRSMPTKFNHVLNNKKYQLVRDQLFNAEKSTKPYYVYVYNSKKLSEYDKELESTIFSYLARMKKLEDATKEAQGNIYFLDISVETNKSIIGHYEKIENTEKFSDIKILASKMPILLEVNFKESGPSGSNVRKIYRYFSGFSKIREEISNRFGYDK